METMETIETETKEEEREIALSKLDGLGKGEMLSNALVSKWRDIFMLTKVIISLVGEEKAKELLEKVKYDEGIRLCKEYASRGYPMTIAGHNEAKAVYFKEKVKGAAFKGDIHKNEDSEKGQVAKATTCFLSDAILKVGAEDPETFEVAKYFEPSDIGWANGFNPKMKVTRTKWLLGGDDCCEFVFEME